MLNSANPATRIHNALHAVSPVEIGLYAITLAAHWFSAVARYLILSITLGLSGLITGWPIPVNTIALVLALAPLAISLLAVICPPLIAPLDGRWWEISTGGRPPEQAEHEAFQHAFHELQQIDPRLRPPRHWFVAEEPGQNAAAYSSSLRVDRGLLESPRRDGPRRDTPAVRPPRVPFALTTFGGEQRSFSHAASSAHPAPAARFRKTSRTNSAFSSGTRRPSSPTR
jgi:hypothetical protein